MSREDEVNLRIVSAMVAAASTLLGVRREVWRRGACFGDAVLWVHLVAMNAAAVRLGVPMGARDAVMRWTKGDMTRSVFERELVNFYVERGRQVISEQCAVISGKQKAGGFQKH